jgi:hypothetical protein
MEHNFELRGIRKIRIGGYTVGFFILERWAEISDRQIELKVQDSKNR